MSDLASRFRALDDLELPHSLDAFDALAPHSPAPEPRRPVRRLAVAAIALAVAVAGLFVAVRSFDAPAPVPQQPSPEPSLTTGAIPPRGSLTFYVLGPGIPKHAELAFVDADGAIVRMTDAEALHRVVGDAAWSPNGSRIAFVMRRPSKPGNLFVMNADGSGLHQLTHGVALSSPTWSGDGTQLAFVCTERAQQLCVIQADGSDFHVIASRRGYYQRPQWSPTSDVIVYQSRIDASESGVRTFLIHADGTGERVLPSFIGPGSYPAWSPDGTRLVYAAWPTPAIYDLTTRAVAPLGCAACRSYVFPAWAPDGSTIAFARQGRHGFSLVEVDVSTGRSRRVVPPAGSIISPTWRP